ncbi:transcription termination/antitermination NusG family protein [Gilvimarinus sp. F26214L]|uniref:transcription termination/antitermination NusG family protein n=1 Tax=Gilvimarinus sp. DZF01 TaxID=3461371 RepID=UPI004046407E
MNWYLLKSKARQELRAKENLENQSIQVYLPMLTRKTGAAEPLFPGYLFVPEDADRTAMGKVRSTRGVLGFVRFGTNIARAPEFLIEDLKALEARYRDVPRFARGQKVRFKSGPMAGLQGIFEAESGEQRCIILLDLLSSPRPVQVPLSELDAL